LAIGKEFKDNSEFCNDPTFVETLSMKIDLFKKIGYVPPWIGYFVQHEDRIVGSGF
jgi:[ribosomal protein S5]-alanine N-acetyltransferase